MKVHTLEAFAKRIFPLFCVILIILQLVPALAYASTPSTRAWRRFNSGNQHLAAGRLEEALSEFIRATEYMPKNASYLRAVAELLERLERFEEAADAFAREAAVRRENGEIQAALVLERRASNLRSELEIFVLRDSASIPRSNRQRALYEPSAGLYFGAFVEQDRNVGRNNQDHFNALTGRQHTIFFNYHPYGMPFPHNWARIAKEAGAAIHLALEPQGGLEMVKDDEYLRQFARVAYAAQVPIFLRFASEMNGDWVRWHGNPQLYIEKWRIVARVMREEAPNVAMVWTPNSVPVTNIQEYYPGDEYVDWVGVNLYSVAYFDGDRNRPAYNVNPLDLIRPVYDMFSDRKPIQVSEFGATHFTTATNRDVTDFAITKMHQLYHGVNMLMPRVKNINWFSMNTITDAHKYYRRLNNFSITENARLKAAYKEMLGYPYFLDRVVNGPFADEEKSASVPVRLSEAEVLSGEIRLQAWAKTYDPLISRVEYTLNGRKIASPTKLPYSVTIDASTLTNGINELRVAVFDSKGRTAVARSFQLRTTGGVEAQDRTISFTLGQNTAQIDNRSVKIRHMPLLINGATFVPIRFVAEKLEADVAFNAGDISIRKGNRAISLRIGQTAATVNGEARQLSRAAFTQNGVTFVPLRFIAEAFDANVQFAQGIITIKAPLK